MAPHAKLVVGIASCIYCNTAILNKPELQSTVSMADTSGQSAC